MVSSVVCVQTKQVTWWLESRKNNIHLGAIHTYIYIYMYEMIVCDVSIFNKRVWPEYNGGWLAIVVVVVVVLLTIVWITIVN